MLTLHSVGARQARASARVVDPAAQDASRDESIEVGSPATPAPGVPAATVHKTDVPGQAPSNAVAAAGQGIGQGVPRNPGLNSCFPPRSAMTGRPIPQPILSICQCWISPISDIGSGHTSQRSHPGVGAAAASPLPPPALRCSVACPSTCLRVVDPARAVVALLEVEELVVEVYAWAAATPSPSVMWQPMLLFQRYCDSAKSSLAVKQIFSYVFPTSHTSHFTTHHCSATSVVVPAGGGVVT